MATVVGAAVKASVATPVTFPISAAIGLATIGVGASVLLLIKTYVTIQDAVDKHAEQKRRSEHAKNIVNVIS